MKRCSAIIAFIVAAWAFASCKKNSGPADLPSVQQNNNRDTLVGVTATVDSANWSTDSAHGYKIHSYTDSGVVDLMITATRTVNGATSTIQLYISKYAGTGAYAINPPAYTATYYNGSTRHFASAGQITVTSDNAYGVVGTFQFTADSVTITNGKFNVASP